MPKVISQTAPGLLLIEEIPMPRYIVERNFPDGLALPTTTAGSALCRKIVKANAEEGVTWLHSYVSADKSRTYCVYDAPTPEAIREVAHRNELPVNAISEVSVLDPYFYLNAERTSRVSAGPAGYRAPWRPFKYFL
jgi:hypothetical protein